MGGGCVLCKALVLLQAGVGVGVEGVGGRVGNSVLFRSEHSVLFRSKKRTLRSFPFFSRVFGDL